MIDVYLSRDRADRKPEIMFDDTDDETDRGPPSLPITRVDSWGTTSSQKQMSSEDDQMDSSLQNMAKEVNVKFGSTTDEEDFTFSKTMLSTSSVPQKKRLSKKGRGRPYGKKGRISSTRGNQESNLNEPKFSAMSFSKNFDFPDVSYTGAEAISCVKQENSSFRESTMPATQVPTEGLGGTIKPLKITFGKDKDQASVVSCSMNFYNYLQLRRIK